MGWLIFVSGLAVGLLLYGAGHYKAICIRRARAAKILTSDNQGDNKQVIPIAIRMMENASGAAADVINSETGQKLAFSGPSSFSWIVQYRPGEPVHKVACCLSDVPMKKEPQEGK